MKFNPTSLKRTFLFSLVVIFYTFYGYSQSDTPCGTSPLTLGSECNFTTHDASVDTYGTEGGTPSCGYYTSALVYEDTWYSFVVPASGNVNIELGAVAGSAYDYAGMALYNGDCNNLNELDCYHSYGASTMPHFELSNLTPGDTYFIRVWGIYISSSNTGNPRTIDFCAFEPAPPPGNDECTDAYPAIANASAYCDEVVSGTIEGATESSQSNWCGGNVNDDVWFSFEAVNTTHYFNLNNITGSTTDLQYQVFSGSCGALSNATCNSGVANSLIIGDTYYVRVWSVGSTGENTTFDLCISSPPIQPDCAVNDPAGNTTCTATPICNLDGYCGTTSSTYSSDSWTELQDAFSCGTLENNSFLSFVAAESTISFWVWVENSTNASGIQIMVFSADNCGSGPVTSYNCWSPGNVSVAPVLVSASGLTAGNEYYIMIDGNAGDVADYTIAAHEGIETTIEVGSVSGVSNICLGESLDLYATGGFGNYTWTPATDLNSAVDDTVTTTPTNTGSYTYTASTLTGNPQCPSPISADFTLTVTNGVFSTDTQIACGSYNWIDGVTYTADNNSATHTIIGGAVSGCDSIITLNLTIAFASTGTDTQITCGAYTWIDGNTYTTNNNSATHTIVGGAVSGCDSIVTLDLTITSAVTGTDIQTTCGAYTWIDGNTYTTNNNSATHTIVGGAVSGCDSIVTLDLTITSAVTGTDIQTTCGAYTWIDGNTYTTNNNSATHTIVGGAVSGCDSIVTLDLTITSAVTGTDIQIACESYTWINGITYSSNNNTATHTIVGGAVSGCDSTVTLNLTINYTVYSVDNQSSCDSFTWIDGITYNTSNNSATHTIVGGAASGCDSIVTLNLTMNYTVYGVDTHVDCGVFTWIDGINYTTNNDLATYTYVGGASTGCDSIVTLNLIMTNVTGIDTQVVCSPYIWIDGNTYTSDNNTATHTISGGSVNGCDSTVSLNLTFLSSFEIFQSENFGICEEPIELILENNYGSYLWTDGSTTPTITVTEPGFYTVTVTDFDGCTGLEHINVIPDCPFNIWVPNAFTPNNDAHNNTFQPIINGIDTTYYTMHIFNRWGELIFETNNYDASWDGKYLGEFVQDDVYVWKILFKMQATDEKKEYMGHVNVLK